MDGTDVSDLAGANPAVGVISRLPWWLKLGAKLLLARLPLSYGFWRRIGLFRHGEMNVPARALRTFEVYYQRASEAAPEAVAPGFRSLELGPGDSVLSGLVARAFGAREAWLVDAGAFAETDIAACHRTLELLQTQGRVVPQIEGAETLPEVLRRAKVHYLTEGTASLAAMPEACIDFFWSQVVLEHVPRAEFKELLRQLRRVAVPGAIGVHSVDFRDHLGGGLYNLRFSDALWEGDFFRSSGFYTNRLRPREMLALLREAGFSVEVLNETRWPAMPIRRRQLAPPFRAMPDEDFMVAEVELLLRPGADAVKG